VKTIETYISELSGAGGGGGGCENSTYGLGCSSLHWIERLQGWDAG